MMFDRFSGFGGMGYGTYGGGSWLFMGIGMLLNALFWGAIIYFVYRFFDRRNDNHYSAGPSQQASNLTNRSDNAEEILRQRYARGEVTQEQYLQMLETLRK
ncbi:MAG: SHOCT domain-containing protein [Carboxydocellales bacterium]